jgi:hypothetical protein
LCIGVNDAARQGVKIAGSSDDYWLVMPIQHVCVDLSIPSS